MLWLLLYFLYLSSSSSSSKNKRSPFHNVKIPQDETKRVKSWINNSFNKIMLPNFVYRILLVLQFIQNVVGLGDWWQVSCDTWHMIRGTWYRTHDRWQVHETHGTWNMIFCWLKISDYFILPSAHVKIFNVSHVKNLKFL